MVRIDRVVVTCEHGGNRVPAEYARIFRGAKKVLESHRGYDLGALALAKAISRRLGCELIAHTITRLLVEPNRSIGHPALFSEFSRPLAGEVRRHLVDACYFPHRDAVEAAIDAHVRSGERVLHLGVHTFAPVLDGEVRKTDIGLLYDPKRKLERAFCDAWRARLVAALPDLRIRRNDPYRGAADGLTTALRRQFLASRYLGIELEVSQKFVKDTRRWRSMMDAISCSIPGVGGAAERVARGGTGSVARGG